MNARVSSGLAGLDEILTGGPERGQAILVEGVPGAGKTTLGMQFIHAGALKGEPGIVVTFELLPEQLWADAARMGWDWKALEAEGKLRVLCTGPQVFLDELSEVGGFVDMAVAQIGAERILIDSVSHLNQLTADATHLRGMTYSLINGLRRAGLTAMITKELENTAPGTVPFEEYLCDTVIRLTYELEPDLRRRRYVEVLKSRGIPHIAGKHTLELTDNGAQVYPRRQPRRETHGTFAGGLCRAPSGCQGLDDMLAGGFICGFSTLIAGSAGVGKTTLGLQFICQGAQLGEPGLYISFEESPSKLAAIAAGYDLNLAEHVQRGLVTIRHESPTEVRPDKLVQEISEAVAETGTRRLVIDSLTDIEVSVRDPLRLREMIYTLFGTLEEAGVTSLLVIECDELFGSARVTHESLSIIVDGIILMKYVELESEIQRCISVLKMRGTDHDKDIRRYSITRAGIVVEEKFEGTENVMGGAPHSLPVELSVRSFAESDARLNAELLERFAQVNPQIKPVPLSVPYNPDEARDTVIRALSSPRTNLSAVPLCMYWMPQIIEQGGLLSLDDIVPHDTWEHHLSGMIAPAVREGHIYAAPAISLCGVLLYRKDILEEHGFSAPPRTWEELVIQAKTVIGEKSGEEGIIGYQFPGYLYEGLSTTFLQYLWSNGGDVCDAEGNLHITPEQALDTLQFLHDAIYVHKITPGNILRAAYGMEPQTDFLEGRVLFLSMLPSVYNETRQQDSPIKGNVGIAPPPVGPRGTESHSFFGGWHYAIPKVARAPRAAREFIRFMTSYEVQRERALRGGPLPTFRDIFSDPEVLAFNPHYEALEPIIQSAKTREQIPHYPQLTKLIQRTTHTMLQGNMTPQQALETLISEVEKL